MGFAPFPGLLSICCLPDALTRKRWRGRRGASRVPHFPSRSLQSFIKYWASHSVSMETKLLLIYYFKNRHAIDTPNIEF